MAFIWKGIRFSLILRNIVNVVVPMAFKLCFVKALPTDNFFPMTFKFNSLETFDPIQQ